MDTDDTKSLPMTAAVIDYMDTLPNTSRHMHYWTPNPYTDYHQWRKQLALNLHRRRPIRQSYRIFMDEHRLWRPSMSQWLKESYVRADSMLTDTQRADLKLYQSSSYKVIVEQYLLGNERQRFHAFDDLWKGSDPVALPLPRDVVLFEGRTDYQPEKVGSIIRRFRPTSTSWTLGVAVSFAEEEGKRPVVFVHRCPDSSIRGINMQLFVDYFPECEVLLQPRIQLRIDQILENVSFTDRKRTRSHLRERIRHEDDWDGPVLFDGVTVVFTTATRMSD